MLSDLSSADPASASQVLSMTSEPEGAFSLLIAYALFALCTSFLCSLLEATLYSTPITFINLLDEQGKKGAKLLKHLKTNKE